MPNVSLTIFANFKIDNEERYLRMKDSFISFKDISAEKWVINIRGSYKSDTFDFLEEHLGEKLYHYDLQSSNGWFHDTRVMLKDINCKHVIIGHSERRKYYFEDHIILKRKIESVINAGLIPIYCIGEDINIKRKDKTKNHLLRQLLNTLPKKNKNKIIIAYEPIWSIGTGNTPTVNEIEDVNLYIKKIITKINLSYEKTSILYGGSVNKHNSLVFLDNKNIDGLLIGGASLNLNTFSSILTYK